MEKKNSFYLSRKRDSFNVLLQHFVFVVNDKEKEMFSSFPCVGENFSFRQIENFVYYVLILLDRWDIDKPEMSMYSFVFFVKL